MLGPIDVGVLLGWLAAVTAVLMAYVRTLGEPEQNLGIHRRAPVRDRARGVKGFGALIPGHGGIMDHLDSLAFAGPILFHLTRFFFA